MWDYGLREGERSYRVSDSMTMIWCMSFMMMLVLPIWPRTCQHTKSPKTLQSTFTLHRVSCIINSCFNMFQPVSACFHMFQPVSTCFNITWTTSHFPCTSGHVYFLWLWPRVKVTDLQNWEGWRPPSHIDSSDQSIHLNSIYPSYHLSSYIYI